MTKTVTKIWTGTLIGPEGERAGRYVTYEDYHNLAQELALYRLQSGAAHEPAGDPLALAIVEEVIRQHPQIECKGGKCPETMWCEQEAECLWTRWNK